MATKYREGGEYGKQQFLQDLSNFYNEITPREMLFDISNYRIRTIFISNLHIMKKKDIFILQYDAQSLVYQLSLFSSLLSLCKAEKVFFPFT